jgi:hypothetical protein
MDRAVKTIAAVQGAPSAVVRDIFRALVAHWQPSVRIAAVLEENHGQDNQVCGAGYLRSIASGARYLMFQDLARRPAGSIRRGVLLAGGTKRSAGSTHSRRRKMGWSGWQGMGSTSQSQAARCGERDQAVQRAGYARLFAGHDIPVDANKSEDLVLSPRWTSASMCPRSRRGAGTSALFC